MKVKLPIARVDALMPAEAMVEYRWYSNDLSVPLHEPRVNIHISASISHQEWLERGRPMELTVDVPRPPK